MTSLRGVELAFRYLKLREVRREMGSHRLAAARQAIERIRLGDPVNLEGILIPHPSGMPGGQAGLDCRRVDVGRGSLNGARAETRPV